jgi:predicted HicB family RNase H-like nuclease
MKVKSFPLRLSEEMHKELKLYCVEKGISMQDFIMKAIEERAAHRVFTTERKAV